MQKLTWVIQSQIYTAEWPQDSSFWLELLGYWMISHVVYGIPRGLWSHARPHPGIPCVPCTSAMRAQLPYLDVGLINLQGNPSVSSPSLTWPPSRKHLTQCFSRKCLVAVWRLGPSEWVSAHISHGYRWAGILLTGVPKVAGGHLSLCLGWRHCRGFGWWAWVPPRCTISWHSPGCLMSTLDPPSQQKKPQISPEHHNHLLLAAKHPCYETNNQPPWKTVKSPFFV